MICFDLTPLLIITTHIGCPINCKKYCPQEILIKQYKGTNNLELNEFKIMLSTIPDTMLLDFSGFSEPFINPNCLDLMEYASNKGHPLLFGTTLVGLKLSDFHRFEKLNIVRLLLHLPDSYENAHIPISEEYKEILIKTIKTFPNITFVSMNGLFYTNNRENITRGIIPKYKWYPIKCARIESSHFVLLPNGDVHLCCMDFGLKHKLGNLLTTSYTNQKFKRITKNKI